MRRGRNGPRHGGPHRLEARAARLSPAPGSWHPAYSQPIAGDTLSVCSRRYGAGARTFTAPPAAARQQVDRRSWFTWTFAGRDGAQVFTRSGGLICGSARVADWGGPRRPVPRARGAWWSGCRRGLLLPAEEGFCGTCRTHGASRAACSTGLRVASLGSRRRGTTMTIWVRFAGGGDRLVARRCDEVGGTGDTAAPISA